MLFHCDNYIIDKYHRGTFGTIIRFFPMFDFKNNDSDIVIIIDSDEYGNNLDKLLETINFLKKNDNLEGLCLYFQGSFAKQINKINGNNIAYCMANTLINKEKIKKSIIENYLKNIFTSNHD